MPSKVNVLMTGGGAPGAPGIIQCLLQADWINLIVGDADADAVGSWLHPQFIQLPRASDPSFIKKLLGICIEQKIEVLMPLVTKELLLLAAAKKTFDKNGIRILVSDERAIAVANNKTLCYQYLQEQGIKVPKFEKVSTANEFKAAAAALGFPKEAICFKPSVSNGSRGFRVVQPLIDEADLLFHYKPYQTEIAFSHALEILSSKPFPELLVTEFLPGEEYSVDCLASSGKGIAIIPRLRIKMVNGISTAGVFVNDAQIIKYCSSIIEAIGLHGNIGIQVKRSKDGEPLLLEINPRVQGTIVAGLGAGINLPLLAVQQELGMAIELHKTEVRWGTTFRRYWTEVYSQLPPDR